MHLPASTDIALLAIGPATWTTIVLVADLLIRVGLSIRVVMRRRQVGVTFAWLTVILLLPLVGAAVYLLFGELRLGNRRAQWAARIHEPYDEWLADQRQRFTAEWSDQQAPYRPVARLTEAVVGMPVLPGNRLELLDDWQHAFRRMIEDIDAARHSCLMEFYIVHPGGAVDEVADALVRARERGVSCRVLVDDVGSRSFLRSQLARRLRSAGVSVQSALRAGLLRMLFVRFDLRMHRKIVVIDAKTAYTGSLNMVDPRHFKQDAGVGQWVDAMVRVEGPAVEGLLATFLEDWELETDEGLDELVRSSAAHRLYERGHANVQVVPSGPLLEGEAMQRILLTAIYAARKELVLTTPYFVPDEALLTALVSAAERGIDVTLVVPARVDSLMVRLASAAFKGDLLAAGVRVKQFDAGLLHTKSVTVDGELSLFGSLNLDPRSLHLNFEITLAIYDSAFTRDLRALQDHYIAQAELMDLAAWQNRSRLRRFTENAFRLLGPLL